jgi:hypothetical protein
MDHVKPTQADQQRGKAGLGREAAFYSSKKIRPLLGGTHSGYGGKQYSGNHGYSTYPQHDSHYVQHSGKGKLIHHAIYPLRFRLAAMQANDRIPQALTRVHQWNSPWN